MINLLSTLTLVGVFMPAEGCVAGAIPPHANECGAAPVPHNGVHAGAFIHGRVAAPLGPSRFIRGSAYSIGGAAEQFDYDPRYAIESILPSTHPEIDGWQLVTAAAIGGAVVGFVVRYVVVVASFGTEEGSFGTWAARGALIGGGSAAVFCLAYGCDWSRRSR